MKRSLLIVDDVKMNREILKKILGDDYMTYEAGDGREALACMSQIHKELSAVLLDLSMPVMDGFSVLTHMQGDPLLKPIPVIVATGRPRTPPRSRRCRWARATTSQSPTIPQ